jgi:hypothetical protein
MIASSVSDVATSLPMITFVCTSSLVCVICASLMVLLDHVYTRPLKATTPSPPHHKDHHHHGRWWSYKGQCNVYKSLDMFDRSEWNRWIITCIQNLISFPLSCYVVYDSFIQMNTSTSSDYERTVIGYRSTASDMAIILLMGHGMFDLLHWLRLIWRARQLTERGGICDYSPDWSLVIHHLTIPLLCPIIIWYNGTTSIYGVSLILHEGSSPFIVIRSLMLMAHQYGTSSFVYVHIILDITFQCCHSLVNICIISHIIYHWQWLWNASSLPRLLLINLLFTILLLSSLGVIWGIVLHGKTVTYWRRYQRTRSY